MRRTVALGVAVAAVTLTLTGCATGKAKAELSVAQLAEITGRLARQFTETSRIAGHVLSIRGLVEDDYRYEATVSVDGRVAYEEVVADDARYVRVVTPDLVATNGDAAELGNLDPSYAAALDGQWVVDVKGAPPEFRSASLPVPVPLNADLVLGAVRFLERMSTITARGTAKYNKDSISYLPKDDRFAKVIVPSATRYDVRRLPYDPNHSTITLADVQRYFQWAAVWTDKTSVRRIELRTEFPDPPNYRFMYSEISRAGSSSLQDMLRLGPAGWLLTDSYTVRPDPGAHVAVPSGATAVDLSAAFIKAVPVLGARLKKAGTLTGLPT